MPQRVPYHFVPSRDSKNATRDVAFIELAVLSQLDGDAPPSLLEMAKVAIQNMELDDCGPLKPVLERLISPEYAEAVLAKIAEGPSEVNRQWVQTQLGSVTRKGETTKR
jgi:hypothetical protein